MEPEAMTGGATGYKSQMAYEPESFIGRSYGVEPEAMTGVVGGASVYGVRASVYGVGASVYGTLKILVSAPVPLELIWPLSWV